MIAEAASLLQTYWVSEVTGDKYGGEFPREAFRSNGIAYEIAEAAKSDLYLAMLPRVNAGTVELPDLPELLRELRGLERKRGSSGRDRVDHRPGAHDDQANAVAGLLSLLPDGPVQPENALISLEWITRAQTKGVEILERFGRPDYRGDGRGTALGLVVADEDSGLTVLSMIRAGLWSVPLLKGRRAWRAGRDLGQAVALVQDAIQDLRDVRVVLIDDLPLGQGVTARLLALQREGNIPRYYVRSEHSPLQPLPRTIPIESCNLDARAWSEHRFADRCDELWWNAREAIRQGVLALPSPEEITRWGLPVGHDPIAQLSVALYGADASGRIVVWDERGARGAVEKTRHLPAGSPTVAQSHPRLVRVPLVEGAEALRAGPDNAGVV